MSPMAPRHPPEMVPILAAGWLGFFSRIVVSVKGIRPFLFFFIVDVSRDRRLSPFTHEPERQWDRIILREEGRTSSPGYDVSRQRKKRPVAKGHHVRDRKRKWRKNLIICQDSKVAWLCLFEANILGLFGQRISGRIGGFHFLFFFCTFERLPVWHRRHDHEMRFSFSLESFHLKLALEFLDYRWCKSLECMNLSGINHHDFAKMQFIRRKYTGRLDMSFIILFYISSSFEVRNLISQWNNCKFINQSIIGIYVMWMSTITIFCNIKNNLIEYKKIIY